MDENQQISICPAIPKEKIHLGGTKFKLIFLNGDIYEGDVVNEIYNGYGSYTSESLGSYKGDWKDGKFQGHGVSVDS